MWPGRQQDHVSSFKQEEWGGYGAGGSGRVLGSGGARVPGAILGSFWVLNLGLPDVLGSPSVLELIPRDAVGPRGCW